MFRAKFPYKFYAKKKKMGDRVLTKNFILGKTRLDNIANVKNLNFWGQELTDVSIISEMPFVEVVSLSVNNITTLKPFENCLY